MNKIKKVALFFGAFVMAVFANAQTNADAINDVAKAERTQQSLYIVMAVVITIVVGLFLYLISLDRKISKLEK